MEYYNVKWTLVQRYNECDMGAFIYNVKNLGVNLN